jgi:putative chitinase
MSAAWFWSVNKCGALADANDFTGLTKKINGGTIGLADRERRYKAVLATIA